jgi:hypothetical protein
VTTEEFTYDENKAIGLIDKNQVIKYFQTIFGEVQWTDTTHICLRGIGEKGTPRKASTAAITSFSPTWRIPPTG